MAKKLTKKDLLAFRKIILKKKEALLAQIKHSADETTKKSQKEAAGDISAYTYHMADIATDTYDREFALGLASNERQIVMEMDDALKRIEEGTYGMCEDCKNLISRVRLRAVPSTRLCLKCQEQKEKA